MALVPSSVPRLDEVSIDGTVLVFTLAITAATGLLFGLLPARTASRVDLQEPLKVVSTSLTGRGRRHLRAVLVVVQVAVALVLLIGAGLLTRTFARLTGEELGFLPDNVLTFQVAPEGSATQRLAYYRELLERLESLPGVLAVGANSAPPLSGVDWNTRFVVDDSPAPPQGGEPTAQYNSATPGYFEALEISVVEGRALEADDAPGRPPVVVVNETLARRHWDGRSPVGRTIRLVAGDGERGPEFEVVGVVADVRKLGVDRDPPPEIFLSALQAPGYFLNYVVRTRASPLALAEPIRAVAAEVSGDVLVEDLTTMTRAFDAEIAQPRFNMLLMAGFATLALLLATLGIYGVLSQVTAERTREIGVRMALGARRGDIHRLVIGRGAWLTGIGLALGLVVSLSLTRALRSLLYETSATDPATFAAVISLLALVAAVATWVPARRATKVSPLVALRD